MTDWKARLDPLPPLLELIKLLNEKKADYLVIGGHARALYGHPRNSPDMDVWIGEDPKNQALVLEAFREFGAPKALAQAVKKLKQGEFLSLGESPHRIDVLTAIPEVDFFEQAIENAVTVSLQGVPIRFPSREDFMELEQASGDTVDLNELQRFRRREEARKCHD